MQTRSLISQDTGNKYDSLGGFKQRDFYFLKKLFQKNNQLKEHEQGDSSVRNQLIRND